MQPVNLYFKHLRFKGAFGYGSEVVDVPLSNQGNVYICGDEGSGKSSSWKLLFFILFGYAENSEGDKLSGNDIVNRATQDFWSELQLDVNGKPYRFVHEKVGTSAMRIEIHAGEKNISPKGFEDAKAEIRRIICVTPEIFNARVYLRQYSSPMALFGTPSERANFLTSIGGLDVYDDMSKECSAIVKDLKARHVELERALGQYDFIQTRLKELGSVEQDRQAIVECGEKAKASKRKADELQTEVNRLHGVLAKACALEEARTELETLQKKHKLLDSDVEFKQLKACTKEAKKLNLKLARLESEAEESEDREAELKELLTRRLEEPTKSVKALLKAHETAREEQQRYIFEVQVLKAKLTKLKTLKEGECDTCGTPLTAKHISKHIAEVQGKLTSSDSALKQATSKVRELKARLTEAEEYEEVQARIEVLRKEAGKGVKGIRNKVRKARKKHRRLSKRADVLQEALSLKKMIAKASIKDSSVKVTRKLSKCEEKLSTCRDAYVEACNAKSQHETRVEEYETLVRKSKRFKKEQLELNDTISKIAVYEGLVYAFSIKGLKAQMLSRIDDIICSRMNTYIANLGDLKLVSQGKAKGKIEVERGEGGKPLALKQLSGGQIGLLSGVMMKAFGSVMPVQCNIRILDEPAVGVGDDTFAEMMRSLDTLSDGCESLFIISYRQGEFDDFDQKWKAEFDGGFSRLSTN